MLARQVRLQRGVQRIEETRDLVAEMQVTLHERDAELASKNEQANERLAQMVATQREAERRRAEATNLAGELAGEESASMQHAACSMQHADSPS